jgi:hypothetical protein
MASTEETEKWENQEVMALLMFTLWKEDSSVYCLKLNSVDLIRERTISTEQLPLVGEVSENICGYTVSHDPLGSILGFLDRSHYYFFKETPQLYSLG